MKRTLAMLAAILLPFVAMSASYTNSFVRNGVTYVQRGGLTIKDYVVTNVTSSGSGSLTTNDVCAIVTNTVPATETWETYTNGVAAAFTVYWSIMDVWEFYLNDYPYGGIAGVEGDQDATYLSFTDGDITYSASKKMPQNALGLARLVDLPPLTNDMPSMIASAAQSAISTNNPAFVAAVTNCPVVIATADGTTLGEFGDYGTLGALLAALAAAITWLKTNKADASSLPYALVNVTVENVPYVLGECFPIVYTISGQTTTITDADADGLSISLGNNAYTLYHNGSSLLVMDDGGVYVELDNPSIESLTFNGVAPTANTTQVLGFTPTAQLADRTSSAVSLTESATLVFPAQTAGKARDFVVRLTLTETDNAVPSVTFPADVTYETEGGEWPDLTEAGTYIVRLTEVPTASESETARFFLQCSSSVEDATPPSAGGAA